MGAFSKIILLYVTIFSQAKKCIKDETTMNTLFTRVTQFREITVDLSTDMWDLTHLVMLIRELQSTTCTHFVIVLDADLNNLATDSLRQGTPSLGNFHETVITSGVAWITYRLRGTKRNQDALWIWHLKHWSSPQISNVTVDYKFTHRGELSVNGSAGSRTEIQSQSDRDGRLTNAAMIRRSDTVQRTVILTNCPRSRYPRTAGTWPQRRGTQSSCGMHGVNLYDSGYSQTLVAKSPTAARLSAKI